MKFFRFLLIKILEKVFQQGINPGETIAYHLEGYGKISLELESITSNDNQPSKQLQYENGSYVIRDLAQDIFWLNIIVYFDDIQSIDPKIISTVQLGDVILTAENSDEEDPELAGFASFYHWKMANSNDSESPDGFHLAIPGSFLPQIQISFHRK